MSLGLSQHSHTEQHCVPDMDAQTEAGVFKLKQKFEEAADTDRIGLLTEALYCYCQDI